MFLVVFGPSGVGKGTLIQRVLQKRDDVRLSVSCTTRKPREGEVDGVSYHFLSRQEFEDRIADGQFLEWAEFAGNYYGTPLPDYAADDRMLFFEIERQGAEQLRRRYGREAVLILIAPPSVDELEWRLRNRGKDDEAAIRQRLAIGEEELRLGRKMADYIVINSDLDVAIQELDAIFDKEVAANRL